MTEQEQRAIKWMQNERDDAIVTLDHIVKEEPNVRPTFYAGRKEKAETIIKVFEELERYRAIEKRLADMYGGQLPLAAYVDVLEYALEEPGKPHPVNARILTYEDADAWEAYKAIGIVEECREAVEKQRAKKPRLAGNAMICPNCPKIFKSDNATCCPNCGQKIDWGEGE